MEINEPILIRASVWGMWRAMAFITPGPAGFRFATKFLLWTFWLLMVMAIVMEHESWWELAWPLAILVIALNWRYWLRLPIFWIYFKRHKIGAGFPVFMELKLTCQGTQVMIGSDRFSLLLKHPIYRMSQFRRNLVVHANVDFFPIVVIPRKLMPPNWGTQLSRQLSMQ